MPKSYNPMLYKNSEESEEEIVESTSHSVDKNKIMFYSDVDPKSCLKLLSVLIKQSNLLLVIIQSLILMNL